MDIFYVVPQRSRLGPLLFNIHLCELFYFLEELDIDTTIYTVNEKKSHWVLSLYLLSFTTSFSAFFRSRLITQLNSCLTNNS